MPEQIATVTEQRVPQQHASAEHVEVAERTPFNLRRNPVTLNTLFDAQLYQ